MFATKHCFPPRERLIADRAWKSPSWIGKPGVGPPGVAVSLKSRREVLVDLRQIADIKQALRAGNRAEERIGDRPVLVVKDMPTVIGFPIQHATIGRTGNIAIWIVDVGTTEKYW